MYAKDIFIHLNGGRNKLTDDIDRGIAIAYLELYEETVQLLKVVKYGLRHYEDEVRYQFIVDLLVVECREKLAQKKDSV